MMPNIALHYENLPALAPAFCGLRFTLLQILYCLNYGKNMHFITQNQGESMGKESQVFGQGRHIQIKGK